VTGPSDDVRLAGLQELSATPLRDRLLARRSEFWSGSALDGATVLGLHDPVFFHQFGASARWPSAARTTQTPATCWVR
jgi:hypothetical protein